MGRGKDTLQAIWWAAGYDKRRPTELDAGDVNLTDAELRLWIVYRAHDHRDSPEGVYPGEERLAELMRRSPSAIQKLRASLVKKGWLIRHLRGPAEASFKPVVPGNKVGNASATENVLPIGNTPPATESQARPLTRLEPEAQREAWKQAVPELSEYVTMRALRAVISAVSLDAYGNKFHRENALRTFREQSPEIWAAASGPFERLCRDNYFIECRTMFDKGLDLDRKLAEIIRKQRAA